MDRAGTVVDTEDAAARHMGEGNPGSEPAVPQPVVSCQYDSQICATPVAPTGWPRDNSPPLGLTATRPSRSNSPVERGVRLATIGDAQRLGMQQLGDGKRVMELDQIEIVGTETRLR